MCLRRQWTSFMHPDPENNQLKALQTLLNNLLNGGMSVRTNPNLEMGYNYHRITGPAEWKALLSDGYIWLDYISIPQPLAEKAKAAARQKADEDEVDELDFC